MASKINYGRIAGLTAGAIVACMIADASFLATLMGSQILSYAIAGVTVGKIAVTALGIGVVDYLMK